MHLAIQALSLASLQACHQQGKQIFQTWHSQKSQLVGGRPVGYFKQRDQGFKIGNTEKQILLVQGGGLKLGTSGLQHQRLKPLGNAASYITIYYLKTANSSNTHRFVIFDDGS